MFRFRGSSPHHDSTMPRPSCQLLVMQPDHAFHAAHLGIDVASCKSRATEPETESEQLARLLRFQDPCHDTNMVTMRLSHGRLA